MDQVQQLMIVLNTDITKLREEELTDLLVEAFKEKGYIPTDRPVVVRIGKISSIRAVDKETQEEVEIYAVAQVVDGKEKTVITGRVV